FLAALDAWWQRDRVPACGDDALPFHGGWFLYLGYELAAQIEPRLRLPQAGGRLPVALATRFPAAVIRDHAGDRTWIVAEEPALAAAVEADIAILRPPRPVTPRLPPLAEAPAGDYLAAVGRILDYVRDGDVFQVNLSRAWSAAGAPADADAALFRRLRDANPGPFNGLATWPEGAILSTSPERLVRVRQGRVETRPIAGTRPRGAGAGQDRGLSDELLAHPKERAEHIMLIDLERNDLGRVAVPGTVRVDELMALESYATVHHIVSNVSARLRPDVTPGDVIRAVFPGGTITGCPKVRCMEIISELEGEGRGPYTGSMGYLDRDGSLDLNILIRTLVRDGERLVLRAGAGIVADSDPARELEETRAKARGLLRALTP
ncbi:MAG TPA: aminodeoxychorismate synthase component I, partial [Gammaproteobacteria bacterium]|nr:aminodeoxychorismate synthase component I [Gammaproteobacteria bacterium]